MNTQTGIFCSSYAFGGLEINTIRLAEWMRDKEGLNIALLFTEKSPLLEAAAGKGFSASAFYYSGAFARLRQLHHWVKTNSLHILIIPFNKDLELAALYKRFFNPKIKLVYQQHMQVGISKRDLIHTLRYKAVDAWIAPLQYLKEETLQKTKMPAEKIQVIPFGIEPEGLMNNGMSIDAAREIFGLPQDAIIIGALGRLDPKKGQYTLIEALSILHKKHSIRVHLLMVGDATMNEGAAYAEKIRAAIAENGLQDYVHLQPYLADVRAFFSAIDVFALPSHNETYGMVTLEAMAAGVPVIGTAAGGTVEILEEGKLGYLFAAQDAADFVRAFIAMSSDAALPQRLEAAREAVLRKYSAAAMCKAYHALLQSLSAS